jgi:hypothetical protein
MLKEVSLPSEPFATDSITERDLAWKLGLVVLCLQMFRECRLVGERSLALCSIPSGNMFPTRGNASLEERLVSMILAPFLGTGES